MCSLSKEQSILSRETIQNTFFSSELCPSFDLDFLSCIKQDFLSSIKHPTAEHWHPHAVHMLNFDFYSNILIIQIQISMHLILNGIFIIHFDYTDTDINVFDF